MSPRPSVSSRSYMSSKRLQRVGDLVDRGVAVAHLGEAGGHGLDREILRHRVRELLPGQRRGDRRAGLRPDAVGRGDRAIACVLVVVDEDALAALLLPPLGGHLARQAPLELAPEGDRGVTDVREGPARLDPNVDVYAPASRRLGESDVAELVQEHPRGAGDAHGVRVVRARLRVEVETQLVRMVDVLAPNRPWMERDRSHLGAPADDRHLRGADLIGVATRGKLDSRRLDVVRSSTRDALLEEGVATALLPRGQDDARMDALRPALERGGPPVESTHDAVLDGEVVLDDVELGDLPRAPGLREDHAVGIRHPQLTSAGVDGGRLGGGHDRSSTASGPGWGERDIRYHLTA